jgi:hypothetical protein
MLNREDNLTSIAIDKEFRVLFTQAPVSEPNGQPGRWRARALGFPDIAEEGVTREKVIRQIQARIVEILRHSEIVTLTVPAAAFPTNPGSTEQIPTALSQQLQNWIDEKTG